MFETLRRLISWPTQRAPAESTAPPDPPQRVHSLRDNCHLSPEEHAYCVMLIDRVQRLYDTAPEYVDRRGLDRTLFFPGNEWAGIVPVTGLSFRNAYNDINYMRLMAPFAGFFLVFLDRLDHRLHAEPWNEELLAKLRAQGITDEAIAFLSSHVDPARRLRSSLGVQGTVVSCVDEYKQHIRNVPMQYVVRTPRMFGEIGVEVDGLLVNPDVVLCQSRVNGLLCSGVLDKLHTDIEKRGRARVLEIGPGYGSLAQALKQIYGHRLEYVAVDLPSILYYSSIYLSTLARGEDCHVLLPGEAVPGHFNFAFVANYLLDEFASGLGPIDVALNTMSFPEMTPSQVRHYAGLLKRMLRSDGVLFDENARLKEHHTDSKAILAEVFPHRKTVSSDIVVTKNWCQDVWAGRYVSEIFDRADFSLLKQD